jgi:hypothetical protein
MKQKPLAVECKNANKPETIQAFMEQYKAACERYGIQPEDRYNFDEFVTSIAITLE